MAKIRSIMANPTLIFAARVLLVAVGYALAGRIGMMVASVEDYVTLLWLPAGISVAVLLRWGMSMWPGIAMGAFALEILLGSSVSFAAGVTVGKTLGPVVAAMWLQTVGFRPSLNRRIDVVHLMTAAPAGMAISATGGVITLTFAGIISGSSNIAITWITWWLGDIVGIVVMAPLLLTASDGCCNRAVQRPIEFALWLMLAAASTTGMLMTPESVATLIGLLFLPVPLLVWAAMRFGITICFMWILSITLVSIFVTNTGFGPFFDFGFPEGPMMLWAYLGTLATTGLIISALQTEQIAIEQRLERFDSLQKLLVELATGFVNVPIQRMDEAINEALEAVGRLTESDRAYVFRSDIESRNATNTHEWCAPGVSPEIHNLQGIDIDIFGSWIDAHERGEIVHLPDVSLLPIDSPLRAMLEPQAIRACITVPMHAAGKLIGFVGFDDVKGPRTWGRRERRMLSMLAQMLANVEERRAVDNKLAENETRIRAIGDNLPDGAVYRIIQHRDLTVEIPYISAGIKRVLGFSAEEVMRNPSLIMDSIHEDDRDAYYEAIEKLYHDLTPFDFELRHRLADGTIKWLHARSTAVLLEDGSLMADGVITDITQRKLAEDALRKSEIILRSVSDNLPDMAMFQIMRPAEGKPRYTYISQGIEHILETPVADFLEGRAFFSTCLPPDERERYLNAAIRSIERKSEVFLGVYKRSRRGGFTQWIEIRTRNRFFDDGVVMAEGVLTDVTSRVNSEQALQESERNLRSYIEHAPMAVIVFDRKGNFIDTNQVGQLILGKSLEQLRGTSVWNFITEESAELGHRMFEQLLDGQYVRAEYLLRRSTGETFWVRSYAVTLTDDRFLAYVEDITAQRKAKKEREIMEAELRQAQKMEAVGRLAGGVAHDFNNMLQVILSHADIIISETLPEEERFQDLIEIQRAAQRSTELVRQLLAFSRKQIIMPKVLDLNSIIHERNSMFSRLIGPHINLRFEPETELWHVRMDTAQIDQILTNLIVNARDAMKNPGNIHITTGNRDISPEMATTRNGMRPGQYVRLTVADTGEGMDAETVKKVFEPFFTTKKLGEGTGLGLATVYGIVKQNHGYIDIMSEPGMGTEVEIFLPRHTGTDGEKAPDGNSTPVPKGRETVLIVEDEESILTSADRILVKQGYTTLVTSDPTQALRVAQDHPYPIHLLITDVIMPEMNGRDLHKAIQQARPGIKTLFMSGYSADIIDEGKELAHTINFLQKPFTTDQLARKVREALES